MKEKIEVGDLVVFYDPLIGTFGIDVVSKIEWTINGHDGYYPHHLIEICFQQFH